MRERFIAHTQTDKPYPSMTFESSVEPLPADTVTFTSDILPIATSTTLPQGYYANTGLDDRFPSDRRRIGVIDSAKATEGMTHNALRTLRSAANEVLEPWQQDDASLEALIEMYSSRDLEDFRILTTLFLKVPEELRELAYEDLATMAPLLEAMGTITGLYDISDTRDVVEFIKEQLAGLTGEERVEKVHAIRSQVEKLIANRLDTEDILIAGGGALASGVQDKRINRKRFVADGIDGTMFRYATNNGTILRPDYLLDDTHYESLQREPQVSFDYKTAFLRHMMAGHWALGQDHTFLYRNKEKGMAAAQTGVTPDYAAIRPGNFLYHDLKLLEHGPFQDEFPTDVLFEYIRNHYLRQMDLVVLDEESPVPDSAASLHTVFTRNGERHIVPQVQHEDHVIPFRALKKHESASQYYEYGEECYMAELVDIALQLDKIEELRKTQRDEFVIGDQSFGKHASVLIQDLYTLLDDKSATALVVEQLLFMRGRQVEGGRAAIALALDKSSKEKNLQEKLKTLTVAKESDGNVRPPLTCFYEWFQKHARPVSSFELQQRGVPELNLN